MLGQGRPSSLAIAPALIALALCAVVSVPSPAQELFPSSFGAAPSPPPAATSPAAAANTPVAPAAPPITPINESVRLRITWGGGEAQNWAGQIKLDRGSLSNLKLLGLDADAAGSIWLDNDQVRITSLSPHQSDSFEATANAPKDAKLILKIAAGPAAPAAETEVALVELARRPFQMQLDRQGNSLEIALVPKPTVEISLPRDGQASDSFIFSPGQELRFQVKLDLPPSLQGTTLDLETKLTPARQKDAIWTDKPAKVQVPVSGHPSVDVTVPLPQVEGVYAVHLTISRPSGYFRDKFFAGASAPLAERTFEVTVLGTQPTSPAAGGRWSNVLEIDPTNPRWYERLPTWTQFRRIPGLNFNHGPVGSIRAGAVDRPLGRFVELPPSAAGAEPHWQAYTLPIEAVGVPHMLEIDYPADKEQSFGLSIVEPNSVGVAEGVHRDAGVFVEGFGRAEEKKRQTQRILFWPRTQTPLLVVTNRHASAPAHYGQIRVFKRNGPLAEPVPPAASRNRLIATYLTRPLVAESFNATQAADTSDLIRGGRSIDDAQTAYESAARLAEYVRYGGFNTAVVGSLAEGSSIFPSNRQLFTPRYDSGRFSERVSETDSLEIALRLFDREGLTLVPAIELATPLAQLEALRRAGSPQATGIEPVGPDGRTWFETHGTRGGKAPYYSLLEPRVQQVILDLVAELVARYGNHPSFGGIALQLTSDGYAQLPPPEWTLDDATITRFEQATGGSLNAAGPERFAARYEQLSGPAAEAWRTWRAEQLASFYARLAEVVRGNTDRRLLLTTERLFDHPQIEQRVRPSLTGADNRVSLTFSDFGLDRGRLERIPGLALCPTLYVEPPAPLLDRAVDLEVNAEFARWRQQPSAAPMLASVLYHRPQNVRLAALARGGAPFKVADDLKFACEPVAHGPAVRRPYLQALLNGDPAMLIDGGDLPPLAQDEMLRKVRRAIASLPTSAQVLEVAAQPVIARTYVEPNQSIVLVMNMSPWPATAEVMLDVPRGSSLEPLVAPDQSTDSAPIKSLQLAAGRQPWSVTLEPYDLQVVRVASPGARALEVRTNLSNQAHAELKTYLTDLSTRDLSARRAYPALTNPSFEPLRGALQGWRTATPGAILQLDATAPQHGKTSLYVKSTGGTVIIESDEFTVPATGQLAMTVFARGRNLSQGSELRLCFESVRDGQVYRRFGPVSGSQLQLPNDQWGRPLAILRGDLPSDSQAKMRVVFELEGSGELWLDNVELQDLLFPLPSGFYGKAQAERLQLFKVTHSAQAAYTTDQRITDCLQQLDGYWPRFVMAYTPPPTPKVAMAPPAVRPTNPAQPSAEPLPNGTPANEAEQASPGIGDRLKRIVPGLR
jgi:hypothetical protein